MICEVMNHLLFRAPTKGHLVMDGKSTAHHHPGILIVDDQALILTMLKLELEPRGFEVWLAVDGDDGLDLYRRHHSEIDVILLDVEMPGMNGPQTLAAMQKINPKVQVCFMTAGSSSISETELMNRGATCVFRKPFRPGDVASCLEKHCCASLSSKQAGQQSRNRIISILSERRKC